MSNGSTPLIIAVQADAYLAPTCTYMLGFVIAALLFYTYRQHSKALNQQGKLHRLEAEQVELQNEISNLTAMLNGQEQERSRLARDLHDGLGGLLSGTKIELSGVFARLDDPFTQQRVTRSLNLLDAAVNELRRFAHNLMPELLLKYGLSEAIREYCNRMSRGDLEVATEIINYAHKLDTNRQVVIYRIIQELVNNAMKHAQAKRILVQLAQYDNTIYLTIEDDGIGFDTATLDERKSAGIHHVQSRLDYLKGHLNLMSKPDIGTTIEIDFPVERIQKPADGVPYSATEPGNNVTVPKSAVMPNRTGIPVRVSAANPDISSGTATTV